VLRPPPNRKNSDFEKTGEEAVLDSTVISFHFRGGLSNTTNTTISVFSGILKFEEFHLVGYIIVLLV
jgi:hypothetical protein